MSIMVGLVYFFPGILYIVFCVFLARRQRWAIVATMVIAGLHGLMGLITLAGAVVGMNVVAIGICALWVAALGQMIYHLAKSFESIRMDQEFAPRGFSPLMPNQYEPPLPPSGT